MDHLSQDHLTKHVFQISWLPMSVLWLTIDKTSDYFNLCRMTSNSLHFAILIFSPLQKWSPNDIFGSRAGKLLVLSSLWINIYFLRIHVYSLILLEYFQVWYSFTCLQSNHKTLKIQTDTEPLQWFSLCSLELQLFACCYLWLWFFKRQSTLEDCHTGIYL